MLDNTTKKRIDDCRDILVGKLPDPKSQIEQITIALIYKFMDDMDKESIDLGGTAKFFSGDFEKFSWDSLFDAKVTATEMLRLYSESIESMEKNPNIPQLFRDIFKNAYLPYRDPETLKLFLKTISEFEYTHSEKLGDAFEYLLSVMGSQGDAGQFRTPRHIIDFLVKAVDPDKTNTILDPACGTAGFLVSAFKYIIDCKDARSGVSTITPDDRKKLIKNFIGYDISPDMVRLSLVNLYLHGFSDPHIFEYDTLTSEERWNDNYDVILANPPFMSPKGGIRPHKKFTVQSKRSEVLFVDYIAEHLNPNGKAGVIVPEGVIFQSGKAYKELRKMLVNDYLYAVVSLPAGVFNPYSGVKTSILLMNKAFAKKNNKILFVKIDNDGYNLGAQRTAIKGGQLGEAISSIHHFVKTHNCASQQEIAHTVEKTKIAENGEYNLSGERYKLTDKNFNNDNYKKLGEVCEFKRGPFGGSLKKEIFVENGYAVYEQSHAISKQFKDFRYFISEDKYNEMQGFEVNPNDIIMSCSGTMGKVAIVPENAPNGIINQALLKLTPKNNLTSVFLKLLMESESFQDALNRTVMGVAIKNVASVKVLKQIKIPLPPLSIQKEIVTEIEGYQKIIDGAKMIVQNYKPQIDIDEDWEMVELGEIAKAEYGYTEKAKDKGNARFIRITDISTDGKLIETEAKYIDLTKGAEKSILKRNDILLARTGATYGKTMIFEEDYKAVFASFLIRLNFNLEKLFPKYYWVFAQSENYIKQAASLMTGGGQPQFNGNVVVKIKLPLPSIEIQKQIVSKIEKEQELVNANKELIKIFEQKIKDRIAKVWGTSTTPVLSGAEGLSTSEDKKEEKQTLSMAAEPEAKYLKNKEQNN